MLAQVHHYTGWGLRKRTLTLPIMMARIGLCFSHLAAIARIVPIWKRWQRASTQRNNGERDA